MSLSVCPLRFQVSHHVTVGIAVSYYCVSWAHRDMRRWKQVLNGQTQWEQTAVLHQQAETTEPWVLNKNKSHGWVIRLKLWRSPRINRGVGQPVQGVNDVRKSFSLSPAATAKGLWHMQEPNWEASLSQNCLGSSDRFSAPGPVLYRSCAWWIPFSPKAWVTDFGFGKFFPPFSLKHQQIVNGWQGRRAKRIGYGNRDLPKLLESLCYWDLSVSSSCVWP